MKQNSTNKVIQNAGAIVDFSTHKMSNNNMEGFEALLKRGSTTSMSTAATEMSTSSSTLDQIAYKLSDGLKIHPFSDKYMNLMSESNSCVLFATDEWFARAENLIKDSEPVFVPDLYCPQGKVMDGWESRRKRTEGNDWCVIATKTNSKMNQNKVNDIVGIEVDTAYFTGNQTPRISIQVANCCPSNIVDDDDDDDDEDQWMYSWMPNAVSRILAGGGIQGTGQSLKQSQKANKACEKFEWKTVLPMTPLQPGYEESRLHYFAIDDTVRKDVKDFTHIRINYFPDGGVARIRLWGSMLPREHIKEVGGSGFMIANENEDAMPPSSIPYPHPELSLASNGGIGLSCSNKHYGVPENLIQSTYGKDMGDGWETARHPNRPPILIKDPKTNLIDNPLMDWAILKLGMGGSREMDGIQRIIVDTKHFKGNFPESVMVEGFNAATESLTDDDIVRISNEGMDEDEYSNKKIQWFPLVPRAKMGADSEHVFDTKEGMLMNCDKAVTHIRVSIFPDGGISRVRVYGKPLSTSNRSILPTKRKCT